MYGVIVTDIDPPRPRIVIDVSVVMGEGSPRELNVTVTSDPTTRDPSILARSLRSGSGPGAPEPYRYQLWPETNVTDLLRPWLMASRWVKRISVFTILAAVSRLIWPSLCKRGYADRAIMDVIEMTITSSRMVNPRIRELY